MDLAASPALRPAEPIPRGRSLRSSRLARSLSLLLMLAASRACGSGESPTAPDGALFLIRACSGSEHAPGGELFRVLIHDPDVIAEAEQLVGRGSVRIVAGPLVRGSGGFNEPWSWHIDPDEVVLADGSIELCDGCPSFIEADLDYWIENVGSYCPWTSEVVSRLR